MKKWNLSLTFSVLVILFGTFLFIKKISLNNQSIQPIRTQQNNKKSLPRIAHAGGAYFAESMTNSLEALNTNANKYEIFELDFNFTSDGELVCIHDWNQYGEYRRKIWPFWKKTLIPPNLKTFERLVSKKQKWTNCTLNTLIKWLDDNPEKRIITDFKGRRDNAKALAYIAKKYPTHIQRFIPQIYKLKQWESVKLLGYNDIILTLYLLGSDMKKQEFAKLKTKNYNLFAITIPKEHVSKFANTLKEIGTPIYTHTVNDQDELDLMKTFGVDEIYTDTLPQPTFY